MQESLDRQRLVIASTNPGKVAEYRHLLEGLRVELDGYDADVEENGDTYEANARIKAHAAAQATGLPALSDDSGLEIAALGGDPGLHSRRLAPSQSERNRVLWERLRGVPRPWPATFVCVLALATPDGQVETHRGEVEGEFLPAPRGAGGFGYDPVFLVPELGVTFAEMPLEEKPLWSHRGRAFDSLRRSGSLLRLASLPL